MNAFLEKLLRVIKPEPPEPRNKALWSIGLYSGASPLDLRPHAGVASPIVSRDEVTDMSAALVADPFLLHAGDTWHLFFEALNRRDRRGEIALATSRDLRSWHYHGVVLAESFHLSYPHVFEWEGARYMVPEARATGSIRLYKADAFPNRWTHVHTLIDGRPFADSTLFHHENRWWLFTETSPSAKFDTLRLYGADDLFGVWSEHPASPIVEGDPTSARPAGSVIATDGGLLRFAQVCTPRYGVSVNAFEITELTPTTYRERAASARPIVSGTGTPDAWNESRMHHIDAHRVGPNEWIAAVDGARDVTASMIWTPRG